MTFSNQRSKIEKVLDNFWDRRSGFAHGDEATPDTHVNVLRGYTHTVLCTAFKEPNRFDEDKVKNLG